MRFSLAPLLFVAIGSSVFAQERATVVLTEAAIRVHQAGLLFDGHNDLPWEMRKNGYSSFDQYDISKPQPKAHTDIPRLRAGGVKAQFWSVYVSADTEEAGTSLLQFFVETVLSRDTPPTAAEHLDPDSGDAPPRPVQQVFVPLTIGNL